MPFLDEQSFQAELDELGEEGVRRNLARGVYSPHKVAWAELWLADRDDARMERANRESLEIARSSKNAAWAAAIAAIISIPIAVASIVISILAVRSGP